MVVMSIFGIFLFLIIGFTLIVIILLLMYRYGYYTNIWPLNTSWFDQFARKLHIDRQNTLDFNYFLEQLWPIRTIRNLSIRIKRSPKRVIGGTVDEISIPATTKSLSLSSWPSSKLGSDYHHNKSNSSSSLIESSHQSSLASIIDDIDKQQRNEKSLFDIQELSTSLLPQRSLSRSLSEKIEIKIKIPKIQMKRKLIHHHPQQQQQEKQLLKFTSKFVQQLKTSFDIEKQNLISTTPAPSSVVNMNK
ncbi:uncharacterized protein LOC142597645 [Dermatophagoides farinae]|uniref:uncharacterized protein LOC142597645 n=1 Tax=Dermatophagoides farinae TaxID=6954 RepID=UPI003F5EB0A8